jgi:hypothetical protein
MYAGLKRHPITTYLDSLADSGLINLQPSSIEVKGLIKKHQQFGWKDDPRGGQGEGKSKPKRGKRGGPGTERNGTERNRTKKDDQIPDEDKFDQFWKSWPIKKSKGECKQYWKSIINNKRSTADQILICAENYLSTKDQEAIDKGMVFNPRNFLSTKYERFLDYLEKPTQKANTGNNGKAKLFD